MHFIYDIELTNVTLLLFFVVPFSYYGYSAKYWYIPEKVKFLNLLLTVISLALIGVVVIKFMHARDRFVSYKVQSHNHLC